MLKQDVELETEQVLLSEAMRDILGNVIRNYVVMGSIVMMILQTTGISALFMIGMAKRTRCI